MIRHIPAGSQFPICPPWADLTAQSHWDNCFYLIRNPSLPNISSNLRCSSLSLCFVYAYVHLALLSMTPSKILCPWTIHCHTQSWSSQESFFFPLALPDCFQPIDGFHILLLPIILLLIKYCNFSCSPILSPSQSLINFSINYFSFQAAF